MKYKLRCNKYNNRHVEFSVFDGTQARANCGTLTILTKDCVNFLQNAWKGDIDWDNKIPQSVLDFPIKVPGLIA